MYFSNKYTRTQGNIYISRCITTIYQNTYRSILSRPIVITGITVHNGRQHSTVLGTVTSLDCGPQTLARLSESPQQTIEVRFLPRGEAKNLG